MTARARLLSVVAILFAGALAVISSTQAWLVVTLQDGDHAQLTVAGSAAVPVLAPLGLAVLALGAALSIVGTVLRYVFGVLTVLIGGLLGYLSAVIVFTAPVSAVASTVTTATGITGLSGVAGLVSAITPTPWPAITLAISVLLLATGVFALITARSWRGSGRKYQSEGGTRTREDRAPAASRRFDAVDSWDDLSRGSDPTTDPGTDPTADTSAPPR